MGDVRLGLISDTHGKLRPQVFEVFQGVDRILHAGDVGPFELLTELEALAPVTAVYGNTDGFDVRGRCAQVAELAIAGHRVVVTHGDQFGSPTPERLRDAFPAADLIVYGHTHRALVETLDGVIMVNPGSAGAARFGREPTVAIARLAPEARIQVDVIDLPPYRAITT